MYPCTVSSCRNCNGGVGTKRKTLCWHMHVLVDNIQHVGRASMCGHDVDLHQADMSCWDQSETLLGSRSDTQQLMQHMKKGPFCSPLRHVLSTWKHHDVSWTTVNLRRCATAVIGANTKMIRRSVLLQSQWSYSHRTLNNTYCCVTIICPPRPPLEW